MSQYNTPRRSSGNYPQRQTSGNYPKQRSRKRKDIASIVAVVLIAVLCLSAFVSYGNSKNDVGYWTEASPSFKVGAIDENGKVIEAENTIYTPDLIPVQSFNLTVLNEDDFNVCTYLYDKDGKFITFIDDSTFFDLNTYNNYIVDQNGGELGDDCFIRISIQPKFDNDISLFEIREYSKQISLHVSDTLMVDFNIPYTEPTED